MTVAIARVRDGECMLACDSRISYEDGSYEDGLSKLKTGTHWAMVYAGDLTAFSVLAPIIEAQFEQHSPQAWGGALRRASAEYQMLGRHEDDVLGIDMLLWHHGRLFMLNTHGEVVLLRHTAIHTIGVGGDVAKGYLHACPDSPLEDAVRAVYAYHATCGGPVLTWSSREEQC